MKKLALLAALLLAPAALAQTTYSTPGGGAGSNLVAQSTVVFPAGSLATGTKTSANIQGLSIYGSIFFEVNWLNITGAPLTCVLQVNTFANSTLTAWGGTITLAPSASTTQLVYPASWPGPLGATSNVVYTCGTYPTGGTMTVTIGASSQESISGATISGNIQGKTATNTAVTNPIEGASRATADSAAPAAVTVGNQAQMIGDTYGRVFVQTMHPNHWSCNIAPSAALQCQAAPGAGLSLYLTDMILNTTTAATTITVQTGTGANCATGTASPAGPYIMNTNGTINQAFVTPIKVPANSALCCTPSAASQCTFNGFTAP